MSILRILPIRHHGSGSARGVLAALEADPPEYLLIEGPPEANELLSLLAHPQTKPPVAFLAHVVGEPNRAVFFPFASFSPEWVAIRWALQRNIPVEMMDLSAATSLALQSEEEESTQEDPLTTFARAAGHSDFESWWDTLEIRRENVFDAVHELMNTAREIESTSARDLLRESAMREIIRKAQKKAQHVTVICGAWHAPALSESVLAETKRTDREQLKRLPNEKISMSLIPWTHGRLARASGYGAGITSPGWYAHLFSTTDHVIESWFSQSARLLRAQGIDASAAQVIDAVQLAQTLARIRGRVAPSLEEIFDALSSVLTWNENHLRLLSEQLFVGEILGEVPEESPAPPLIRDLAALLKKYRLKQEATAREITLDLREESGLLKSQLFHRLNLLGVPWAELGKASTTGTFKELWVIRWDPEYSVLLIEASQYGNTIEDAAHTAVVTRAQKADLPQLALLLEVTRLAGLHKASQIALNELNIRAADADTAALLQSLPPLATLSRYGDVRSRENDDVTPVFRSIVARASAGLATVAINLNQDAAAVLQKQIAAADNAIRLLDDAEANQDWQSALLSLDTEEFVHPLIHGDTVARLRDRGLLDEASIRQRIETALAAGGSLSDISDWLNGFLTQGASSLLHDEQSLALIDAWVMSLDEEQFDSVLAAIRRCFSQITPADRRALGEILRGITVQSAAPVLNEERAMPAIRTGLRFLGVS